MNDMSPIHIVAFTRQPPSKGVQLSRLCGKEIKAKASSGTSQAEGGDGETGVEGGRLSKRVWLH